MLTQHINIKQLDVSSQKISSNNDNLLVEKPHIIQFEDHEWVMNALPQHSEYMIQGLLYTELEISSELDIKSDNDRYFIAKKKVRINDYPLPFRRASSSTQHDYSMGSHVSIQSSHLPPNRSNPINWHAVS